MTFLIFYALYSINTHKKKKQKGTILFNQNKEGGNAAILFKSEGDEEYSFTPYSFDFHIETDPDNNETDPDNNTIFLLEPEIEDTFLKDGFLSSKKIKITDKAFSEDTLENDINEVVEKFFTNIVDENKLKKQNQDVDPSQNADQIYMKNLLKEKEPKMYKCFKLIKKIVDEKAPIDGIYDKLLNVYKEQTTNNTKLAELKKTSQDKNDAIIGLDKLPLKNKEKTIKLIKDLQKKAGGELAKGAGDLLMDML